MMTMKRRTLQTPKFAAFALSWGLMFVLAVFPAAGRWSGPEKAGRRSAADQETNFRPDRPLPRFQLEVYGGASLVNPRDLNRVVDYDNRIQDFFYDSLLAYKVRTGAIGSWTVARDGERKKLNLALPFGIRLKYRWSPALAVSLGLKFIWGKRTARFGYDYTQTMTWGDMFTESENFNPYALSAGGWVPLIGLHWTHELSRTLSLEAFLAGGPIFANCRYSFDRLYQVTIREVINPSQGTNESYLDFVSQGLLEEKGRGTGLAVETGLRLDWRTEGKWGFFAEAGYARQRVKNLSGPGREILGPESSSWENSWAFQTETISTYWGGTNLEFPTNYWPPGSEGRRAGDFSLDLSGFQLRLGLSFRL